MRVTESAAPVAPVAPQFRKVPLTRSRRESLRKQPATGATGANTADCDVRDIDFGGLCRLLRALTDRCACELDEHREDCAEAPLDRWWVAIVTGGE